LQKDEYPHLAKYIKNDRSIIKNKEDLISSARDAYLKEKEEVRSNFEKLLKKL
jgi:hypothetical protein